MPWAARTAGAGTLTGFAAAALRYASRRERVERSQPAEAEPRLTGIGEVDRVSILPLVERLVPAPGLRGEPGVSYLLRADATTLLFDTGLNPHRQTHSALVGNAGALGVGLRSLDGIVISHLHMDHVGGMRSWVGCVASSAVASPSPPSRWSPGACRRMCPRR